MNEKKKSVKKKAAASSRVRSTSSKSTTASKIKKSSKVKTAKGKKGSAEAKPRQAPRSTPAPRKRATRTTAEAKERAATAAAAPATHSPAAEGKQEKRAAVRNIQKTVATARSEPSRKPPTTIPPILLEGDLPTAPAVGGPGERYALGPAPAAQTFPAEGDLPEAYGTQQLLLTARDPHWLYAHWDLSREQQRRYNLLSVDRHLVLRIYLNSIPGECVREIHLHPESRHWFVPVNLAGARYIAELGYYSTSGRWTVISTSSATSTPPETVSEDKSVEFATIPLQVPMEKLLEAVKEAVQQHTPLATALQEIGQQHPALQSLSIPKSQATAPVQWTAEQEKALERLISIDTQRRVWMGSLEITELIRRQLGEEMASIAAAQLGAAQPGAPASPGEAPGGISSPHGGLAGAGKPFWFTVNAELIIYGATEKNATVTIGGRTIRLRPDGSFSYRFALPDGHYTLPISARSADGTDGRSAALQFSRSTEYRGEVGAHPQDPSLKRPNAAEL